MFAKPRSAPVGKPSVVASSSGSAKNARYARLLPSTRKSSASRAGASLRSSSAPVSVFGDISASVRPMMNSPVEIVPFAEEHVDAAAELLAARHERHRSAFPQLPADFDYRAAIAALLADGATGAFTDGAYVLGKSGPAEWWGPNIWIEAAGHAASDPERLRDVWASAAAGWV